MYGRGRKLEKAVEMFNMARNLGMALDEKAYTNLICYYGKAGNCLFLICEDQLTILTRNIIPMAH